MVEAPPFAEDKNSEFYEIEKPVINFEGGVNEIQQKNNQKMKSGAK